MEKQQACFKTKVGGQALIEGVMMRGPQKMCLAVRQPNGEIYTEVSDVHTHAWQKWPLVRGVASLVSSLATGYKCLMKSADIGLTEDAAQPDKFDQWVEKHFGEKGSKFVMALASVLGIVLALGLFMYLPTFLVGLLDKAVPLGWGKTLLEGLVKIGVFVAYLAIVSRMPDIKRVFSYHGAEHKTIACYESGEELTPENARKHSRFHPRCGTSFILIVLVISILVSSLLPWGSTGLRVLYKLLLLPVVMGVSYELIQFCGRHDNPFTKAVSAPGLWLQRLTTNEPDNSMLEVAIAAVNPVLPQHKEDAAW